MIFNTDVGWSRIRMNRRIAQVTDSNAQIDPRLAPCRMGAKRSFTTSFLECPYLLEQPGHQFRWQVPAGAPGAASGARPGRGC